MNLARTHYGIILRYNLQTVLPIHRHIYLASFAYYSVKGDVVKLYTKVIATLFSKNIDQRGFVTNVAKTVQKLYYSVLNILLMIVTLYVVSHHHNAEASVIIDMNNLVLVDVNVVAVDIFSGDLYHDTAFTSDLFDWYTSIRSDEFFYQRNYSINAQEQSFLNLGYEDVFTLRFTNNISAIGFTSGGMNSAWSFRLFNELNYFLAQGEIAGNDRYETGYAEFDPVNNIAASTSLSFARQQPYKIAITSSDFLVLFALFGWFLVRKITGGG